MFDPLKQIIEEILKRANIDKAPEPFKEKYVEKLKLELEKRIGIVALKNLSDEALIKFKKIVKTKAEPKEIFDFFQNNIKNFSIIISKTIQDFEKELSLKK